MLHDEHGRKMTPSHAVKKGKRYRYYITHGGLVTKGSSDVIRLPSNDLEQIIVERLIEHLNDKQSLIDQVESDADKLKQAIKDADGKIDQLQNGMQHQKQNLIKKLVSRINIKPGKLIINLKEGDQQIRTLEAEYVHIRKGNDTKLVLKPKTGAPEKTRNEQLVQLIADSRKAIKLVNNHPNLEISKLASRFGRSVPRFKRLLRLSYLSPAIVEAILAGEQPSDLTSTKLHHIGNLPIDWAKQHEMLGL